MPSRQSKHLHAKSLATIRAACADLPLVAASGTDGGFCVATYDGEVLCEGRYQIVLTFVGGYRSGFHARTPDS